jgi:uncharacterized protein YuzE
MRGWASIRPSQFYTLCRQATEALGASGRTTIKVEYFEDTDILQITFKEGNVADSLDLDENTLIETDADGQLVTITIEHAKERTDLESFLYKKYGSAAA